MFRRRGPLLSTPEFYDHVIIGGGVAGCLVAARTAGPRQQTLLLESGQDPRTAGRFKWAHKMPAAPWLHRMAGFRYSNVAANGKVSAAWCSRAEADGQPTDVSLRVPQVLGGAGVALGSRTFIRGHADDFTDFPLPYSEVLQPLYKRLENVERGGAHRGLHGKFELSKSGFASQLFIPLIEQLTKRGVPLIADFNRERGMDSIGSGRPQVLMQTRTGWALSTLNDYLEFAQKVQVRPLQIKTGAVVTSINFDKNRRATGNADDMAVSHIEVSFGGAAPVKIVANKFSLCAGAFGTARLLLGSPTLPASCRKLLEQPLLWAQPTILLQFPIKETYTLAPLSSPAVQFLTVLEWRFKKAGWGVSSYDDMVVFLSSDPKLYYPDIRVDIQPFMTVDGKIDAEHGFQLSIKLLRPKARYVANSTEISVLDNEQDASALDTCCRYMSEVVQAAMGAVVRSARPRRLIMEGAFGGSCPLGTAVDPASMLLRGTSNLTVVDGSIIPRPLVADTIPMTMVLAERASDVILGADVPRGN